MQDVFAIQEEIAQAIASALEVRLSGAVATVRTDNTRAHDRYLLGLYHWHRRNLRVAIEQFERAKREDAGYALAYAGLALSHMLLPMYGGTSPGEAMPAAKAMALKALELDPRLAEAHAALSFVHAQYDWEYGAAEADARRAIELNPNFPTAHQTYGFVLLASKRIDEGGKAYRRALDLDPLALPCLYTYAFWARLAGRFDEATATFERVLEMEPRYAIALFECALAHVGARRFAAAARYWRFWLELAGSRNDEGVETLRRGFDHAASVEPALETLAEWESLRGTSPVGLAALYAQLGGSERALALLERGASEHALMMPAIAVDPLLDPLRGDGRFQLLLRHLRLETIE